MSESDLERLRGLLLRPEQKRLEKLEQRSQSPDERVAEMVQLLPSALHKSADDGRLAPALAKPLQQGLRETIRKDAHGLAEVLFPIMGPSIRRAIAESLRDFINGMNNAVAQAFSWQGLKWRAEAWRTGRPYGEIVLSHTLSYRVEQALLIHQETGLVVSKAELAAIVANDSDAFSAMLGAIQDFVSDSLKGDNALSTLDMGERTIWIIRGPHAHLACVISGVPQKELRVHLADVLDAIHNDFGELLQHFNGDRDALAGIDRYTERCLESPQAAQTEDRAPRWPLLVLALMGLGAMVWSSTRPDPVAFDQRLRNVLDPEPGLLIQSVSRERGQWSVSLLRDPLAADPEVLLQAAGIDPEDVSWRENPYHSLEAEIQVQRLRQSMQVPEAVASRLEGGVLILSGSAPALWLERIDQMAWLPPGVLRIDTRNLTPVYGLEPLRAALPEGVVVRLVEGQLQFSGRAPLNWIRQLPTWLKSYSAAPLAAEQDIEPVELEQLRGLLAVVDGQSVFFADMLGLAAGEAEKVEQLRERLLRLDALAQTLDLRMQVILTAYSDGLGSVERNRELRTLRGAEIDRLLNRQAMLSSPIVRRSHEEFNQSETPDMRERRVDIQVQLAPLPETWL